MPFLRARRGFIVSATAEFRFISLLYSASCHPSIWYEPEVCGDYPGLANRLLNERFATEGALFLQGCGGDSKPCTVAGDGCWRRGTWRDVEDAGRLLADAISERITEGLEEDIPGFRFQLHEIIFPLQAPPHPNVFHALLTDSQASPLRKAWAKEMLEILSQYGKLPTEVTIQLHIIDLAPRLCLIGLECEPVAAIARIIFAILAGKVVFPLGYTNGAQLYLPIDEMLPQGGYEVDSYWEYRWPAPLAPGIDARLRHALTALAVEDKR